MNRSDRTTGEQSAGLTLGIVLLDPEAYPFGSALYGPAETAFGLDLPVLVHDVDDVEEGADDPAVVEAAGYRYLLDLQTVASIVANARQQRPGATREGLLAAFQHYLRTDAFIVW